MASKILLHSFFFTDHLKLKNVKKQLAICPQKHVANYKYLAKNSDTSPFTCWFLTMFLTNRTSLKQFY